MILRNASIAIAGVYTARDDGVLNPNNIRISPGSIISVASNGGGHDQVYSHYKDHLILM